MTFSLRLALLAGFAAACNSPLSAQSAASRNVVVSDEPAPSGYVRLKELSVKSGRGCGVLGKAGSREGAEAQLRGDAAKLGASYVQLTQVQAPRPNHQCLEHEHQLRGVAYAQPGAATPVASAPAPALAVARSCVPGATQACLGPGACSGAQACRDDGEGFLPCDCGDAAH
jgi:hypothetical protein